MTKTIVITGANGFIGRFLIEFFSKRGYHVISLIHRAYKAALPGVEYRLFDMDSFAGDVIPQNAAAVIHAAYIPYKKGNNSEARNLKATQRLLNIARKKNTGKFVFLSSFSAADDALSHYGKNKYELEQLFDEKRDLVLRPALVTGDGGLYKNLVKIIEGSRIIPLIGGGKQPVQTVKVETLAEVIAAGIEKNISGFYDIAEYKAITMRELYEKIAKRNSKRISFFTIPYFLAAPLVFLLENFSAKPLITKENLDGLRKMKERDCSALKDVFEINLK